jgi:HEAT repeat protein
VSSGESVEMTAYRCGDPQKMYGIAAAERWIDEILVLKGRDNPELKQRIDDLMAQLGANKMAYLFESEIRGLGDHCVVPLTRYIQSDRSKDEPERRRKAARILSDSAQPWCIPYLIELLSDRDADIRATVAAGLARVAGTTIGRDQQWREGSAEQREKLISDWQHWWAENKDKIPRGRESRDASTQTPKV